MKKYDWKNEYNPIRRTAKRLLSGEALTDGRPLSDLIELDEHTRKCLAFEATLTDRQIDMLQELGYLPVIMRQYGEESALSIPVMLLPIQKQQNGTADSQWARMPYHSRRIYCFLFI